MYVVKIINPIKQRGKRKKNEFKFIGELTDEVRKQWKRIFSHGESGLKYKLLTYQEYQILKAKEEKEEEKAE